MEEPLSMNTRRALGGLLIALALGGCASTAPSPQLQPLWSPAMPSERAAAPAPTPPAPSPEPAAADIASNAPSLSAPPLLPLPPLPEPLEPPLIEGDRSNLWDRIRAQMAIPDMRGPRVERWEQHYARRPDYVARMIERGSLYLFHVVEEVEKRGLPAELALLPFIESAFNPQALSRVRASGMWQFMPATGRDFELRQNLFRDDRRAVMASTEAALDYLQRLHERFGDWHLALAAYNWGQGNVSRAIARNQRLRLPTDYESLRMPVETRDYVPKLQAVKNIVLDAPRLGLVLPPLENHPFFARVRIERDIDVGLAAELAEVSLTEFRALNPQFDKPVILAAGTPEVLLPWERAEPFRNRLAAASGPLASWTAWRVPRTMRPAEVAREVGMPEDELREVNRIPPSMLVRAGSTLLVARTASHEDDVAAHVADHGQLSFAPEARGQRRVKLRIGRGGESVASVARRHRVSAVQVARWNGVSPRGRFVAGQTVVVMVQAPVPRQARAARAERPPQIRAARQVASTRATSRATANAGRAGTARAPAPQGAAGPAATQKQPARRRQESSPASGRTAAAQTPGPQPR
jgi:membrane-bound lytic murein transglycosylase D